MHSTSSQPIILHGKGSRPFLVSKLFWLISVLKLQVCNLLCLDFPGKCLRRPENWSSLSPSLSLFFLPALEWWIFHKCIIIITFSKLFAAFLITEQLLIKGNYQTALPHSNNLVFCSFVLPGVTTFLMPSHRERHQEKNILYNNSIFNPLRGGRKGHEPIFSFVSRL